MIVIKVLKYSIFIFAITLIFGLIYFCKKIGTITFFESIVTFNFFDDMIISSFSDSMMTSLYVLFNMAIDNDLTKGIKNLVIIQKFINNIVLAICAAFIFQDMVTQKPSLVFPPKLFLRRRTSHNCEEKLALVFILGNAYGYKYKLYNVTAELTYIYKKKKDLNVNTQLKYSVQTLVNYNSFYFYAKDFPPDFVDCILSQNEHEPGQMNIVIHGTFGPYLHSFVKEVTYYTSDIVIVKTIKPKIDNESIRIRLIKKMMFLKKYIQLHFEDIVPFRTKYVDLSAYEACSNEERQSIIDELKVNKNSITKNNSFKSSFRLKRKAFQNIRPVVSRKKRGSPRMVRVVSKRD